jgi:hypothetical protein
MDIALGLSKPKKNASLAAQVRRLWKEEEERRGGQLWAVHVKAHQGHEWNERADRAAARGSAGFVRGIGTRWHLWPPLPTREPRAHAVSEATRVLRATHAFGALGMPVPVHGVVPESTVRARLARVERRLEGVNGPRAAVAMSRARAAHRLLSEPTRQRAEARRLIAAGLQPTTSELDCPVNLRALEGYVTRAGAEADVVQFDKHGQPRGTLRELARIFVVRLGGQDRVTLTYRHSLLGAELVAAGFIVTSREYALGGEADPFHLPRALREVALSGLGHDMDDVASFPCACQDVFRAGHAETREVLTHRELILAELGTYYFGDGVPAGERRKKMKALFNSLDNDGTVRGWRRTMGIAAGQKPLEGARVRLPTGRVFSLAAYQDSREDMTAEFEEMMPGMCSLVKDWLRARRDGREYTHSRTAKSYFLQEAEGLSRRAKVAWAARRGDALVTNLQHDGIIVQLPDGMTAATATAGMAEASSQVLGYQQLVEEKPLG